MPGEDHANRRVLSDADLAALRDLMIEHRSMCEFDEETRVALKRLAKADPNILVRIASAAENATNYIWKGMLALALVALLWLAMVGFSIEKKLGL